MYVEKHQTLLTSPTHEMRFVIKECCNFDQSARHYTIVGIESFSGDFYRADGVCLNTL